MSPRIRMPIHRDVLVRLRAAGDVDHVDEFLRAVVAPLWIRTTHEDGYNPARPHVRLEIPPDLYRVWSDARMSGPKAYHNLNGLLDKVDRVLRRGRRADTGASLGLREVVEVLEGRGDVEIRIRLSSLLVG